MKRSALWLPVFAASLSLSACTATDDWLNRNMPVIGQRCEHWQCFTESGQAQSELNERERLQREQAATLPPGAQYPAGNPGAANPIPPANATATGAPATPGVAAATAPPTPPPPAAAPADIEPTYKYIPRTAPAPGTTPFDGAIPPPVEAQ